MSRLLFLFLIASLGLVGASRKALARQLSAWNAAIHAVPDGASALAAAVTASEGSSRTVPFNAALIDSQDADLPVTLRLAPSAHWVAEYYPVTSRETAGEDLLVTLPTSNEGFLRRLVLRLGGGAQVVAPESARAAVEGAAEQALSGYDAH